jgi:hypothetical protein
MTIRVDLMGNEWMGKPPVNEGGTAVSGTRR